MSPRYAVRLLAVAVFALAVPAFAPHAHAQCLPATCGGTHALLNFEGVTPGSSVEGLGTLHPWLDIASVAWTFGPSCAVGTAAGIETGNPTPPSAYSTGALVHGCLTGLRGFGDDAGCVLDYDFKMAPGVTASCFSVRMVDYGDLQPFGGATHTVTLTAYDAGNNVVDTDVLVMTGGVDLVAGDAYTAQAGDPGNHLFTVTGAGIVRAELRFDGFPDPNVGFDDISFCAREAPTPAAEPSWGELKIRYR